MPIITPGNAQPGNVDAGIIFNAGANWQATGTMPYKGAVVLTPSGTGTVAIPAGHHNGAGYVQQVTVPAAKVLNDTIIAGVQGTMPEASYPSLIVPGASQQQIAAGHHSGSGNDAVAGDANLVAGNIIYGKSIFGVAGSAKQWQTASGSVSVPNTSTITVSGLAFTPRIVFLQFNSTSYTQYPFTAAIYFGIWSATWRREPTGSTMDNANPGLTQITDGFQFCIPNTDFLPGTCSWWAVAY